MKVMVKRSGTLHENYILNKNERLKDLINSKDYLEVNFTLIYDKNLY